MNNLRHIMRNPHITSAMLSERQRLLMAENPSAVSDFRKKIAKFLYQQHGFCKLGLWSHDVRNDIDPVVAEAIRRLPQSLMEERNYRIARAEVLFIAKTELPKEEWTKWEDDVAYLDPYIEEVRAELKAKKSWARQG